MNEELIIVVVGFLAFGLGFLLRGEFEHFRSKRKVIQDLSSSGGRTEG